ncbi:HAMP domain-containing sensor histidine kinase [Balneolales bacterium ANBcel1]|nr:HAMP domain-containing sensor histidine kinase [Balneolales bacterium ANBcel1]
MKESDKNKSQKKIKTVGTGRIRLTDDPYYNKIAHLNNELANIQRSLAKSRFELEEKNKKLEEQHEELSHLNHLKNEMLGMAAHDLRNPLSTIMALSELLLEDDADELNESQKEFIGEIRTSSAFMLKLVNDMLDLSQIESGSINMELQTVDLEKMLKRSVKLHNMMSARKKIRIGFTNTISPEIDGNTNGTALLIQADPGKLEQAINNLLGNAIKFSPEDTAIEVQTEQCATPGSHADGRNYDAGDILIHIRDKGPGISPDNQKKLFKPFTRIATESGHSGKGTGLGLAITRRIIDAHGWSIHLDSEVGRGSVFTIRIPVQKRVQSHSR